MAPYMWTSSTLANTPPSSPRLRCFNGSDPTTATGSAASWRAKRISTRSTKRWIIPTRWVTVLFFSLLLLILKWTDLEGIDLCTHGALPFGACIWKRTVGFEMMLSFWIPYLSQVQLMANEKQGGLEALVLLGGRKFVWVSIPFIGIISFLTYMYQSQLCSYFVLVPILWPTRNLKIEQLRAI